MILWVLLAACEDKLDITPKGKTVLGTVDELETLLNQEYALGSFANLGKVCNECYGSFNNVPTELLAPNTLAYAYLAYDEKVDRAALTTTDDMYAPIYRYVNYMNVLLDKIGDAEGDEAKKVRLSAEARVMRAYLHWLAVNIYAGQYDEATAETAGGVAYVTDLNVETEKTKLSVAEVYRRILEDCSEKQIACLPDVAPDVCRAGKAWGYAVRAKVLMQMKRYADALACSLKSIEYHDGLEDRTMVGMTGTWSLLRSASNNLLFMGTGTIAPFGEVLSLETAALFEEGDYVRYYSNYMGGMDWGDDEEGDDDYEGDDEDYGWDDEEDFDGDEDVDFDEDEDWGDDDEDWGEIEIPLDPNPLSVWNSMYGSMMGGVQGALMNFGMTTWVNVYGITVDRMYYTAAECYIRTGAIDKGLQLVDEVRRLRIHPDNFTAYEGTATTEEEAMELLIPAKWIECLGTYENFFDSKRRNSETKYRRTISRTVLGGTYELAPDSPLWIFPFPNSAVRYNASLTQNF